MRRKHSVIPSGLIRKNKEEEVSEAGEEGDVELELLSSIVELL